MDFGILGCEGWDCIVFMESNVLRRNALYSKYLQTKLVVFSRDVIAATLEFSIILSLPKSALSMETPPQATRTTFMTL